MTNDYDPITSSVSYFLWQRYELFLKLPNFNRKHIFYDIFLEVSQIIPKFATYQ